MTAIGISLFGWIVKNRFGKEFVGFTASFVMAVVLVLCLDVFSSSINDGWLFFSVWLSLFPRINYSDELNMIVSVVVGTLCVSCILFYLATKNKVKTEDETYVLLGREKNIKVKSGLFDFMFVWHIYLMVLVTWIFYFFAFSVPFEKHFLTMYVLLFFIGFVCMTAVYYVVFCDWMKECYCFQLFTEREKYASVLFLIQQSYATDSVLLYGAAFDEELIESIENGVFRLFGAQSIAHIKIDERVKLFLQPHAKVIFEQENRKQVLSIAFSKEE